MNDAYQPESGDTESTGGHDDDKSLESKVDSLEREIRQLKGKRSGPSVRWRTSASIAGLPLMAVAMGPDFERRERRGHAKGIVAIGDAATGLIAVGGSAHGVLALGGISIGLFSIGGVSLGLIAAVGGVAAGAVAVGGVACGLAAIGGVDVDHFETIPELIDFLRQRLNI